MYIDGVVAPVKSGRHDDYVAFCKTMAAVFLDHGALQVVDTIGAAEVPEGKQTDLWRAVAADKAGGEAVGFGWIVWPSKAARDAGWASAMTDERMKPDPDMPMDGKRMIFGGFDMIHDSGKA